MKFEKQTNGRRQYIWYTENVLAWLSVFLQVSLPIWQDIIFHCATVA